MGALTRYALSSASYTDVGRVRSLNEDALLAMEHEALWAVADGMGGHAQGDYASRRLCETLASFRASRLPGIALARIDAALAACNAHLAARARDLGVDAIGCTAAVLSVHADIAVCSWSGDARIYRARRGLLRQLTRDHTQATFAEDDDVLRERAAPLPVSAMLTHAIGGHDDAYVEHCCYDVAAGDRYLLCTDGLYKELDDARLLECIDGDAAPDEVIEKLAASYHAGGARDNVGLVYVVAVDPDEAPPCGEPVAPPDEPAETPR